MSDFQRAKAAVTEGLARAFAKEMRLRWDANDPEIEGGYRDLACTHVLKWKAQEALGAAISAFSAAGWELVPRLPSVKMCVAGYSAPRLVDPARCDNQSELAHSEMFAKYDAMIAQAIKERT